MKVVHICNTDIRGGAARAAYAINDALQGLGIDSQMLVQRQFGKNKSVHTVSDTFFQKQNTNFRLAYDLLMMKLFTKEEKGRFSFGNIGKDIHKNPLVKESDIIHLHWINEGFLSVKDINKFKLLQKPIVWTFHDMWGFTGGCHYSAGCKRYEDECNNCPFLKSPSDYDSSSKIQKKKELLYKGLNLTIVTCSNWLGECVKKSSLLGNFRVEVIPNTLDLEIYKPQNKLEARKKLNLPAEKLLISFGTMNTNEERKGFKQLKSALMGLVEKYPSLKDKTELLIFGFSSSNELNDIPINANYLGRLSNSEMIALCYNAGDVFVAPSLEDNLPNTVMESLACGTPVAAFSIGGMPDMIDHMQNGYLAEPYSINDLANGIYWCIENPERNKTLSINALEKAVSNFSKEIVCTKYLNLYKSLASEI